MADNKEKLPWEMDFQTEDHAKPADEPSLVRKALPYITKALDYTSGLGRTAAMQAADALGVDDARGESLVKPSDWKAAIQGEAPSTQQYLERTSMSNPTLGQAIPRLKGTPLDISAKGALGFAGDVAFDPATYAGLPIMKGFRYLMRPGAAAAEPIGKYIFSKGLKELDAAALKAGKGEGAVTNLLWDKGISGSNKSIANKSVDAMEELAGKKQALEKLAGDRGARIDPYEIFDSAINKTHELGQRPIYEAPAQKWDDMIQRYMEKEPATPEAVSQWKTDFYTEAKPKAYQEGVGRNTVDEAVLKSMGYDSKNAIEKAVDSYVPEKVGQLAATNKDLGTLLSTADAMGKEALKGERKNLFTSVDAMLLGSGMLFGSAPANMERALILKKIADAGKSTAVRTSAGMGLKNLAQSKAAYPFLKRTLINKMKPEAPVPPWLMMNVPEGE